ncbi:hypothetical protein [Rhizobium giardinii]|uniref:hypothetical protein n=1 Tax=Rhizobium giardinii TaxID=56731 RepID=UPI0013AFB393
MTEYDPAALERKRPDTAKLSAPAKNKHLRQTFSGKFSLADFFSGYCDTLSGVAPCCFAYPQENLRPKRGLGALSGHADFPERITAQINQQADDWGPSHVPPFGWR